VAINTFGLPDTLGGDGTIDLPEWLALSRLETVANWNEAVSDVYGNGFAATATGTRGVRIDTGALAQNGLYVVSDTAVTKTCTANGTSNPRLDFIVMQTDAASTKSAGGTIVVVPGSTSSPSGTLPGLTRNINGIFQTPLAFARIDPGATSAVVYPALPQFRRQYVYRAAAADWRVAGINWNSSSDVNVVDMPIAEVTLPWWPFRLEYEFQLGFEETGTNQTVMDGSGSNIVIFLPQGHAQAFLYVNGTLVKQTINGRGNSGPCTMFAAPGTVFDNSNNIHVVASAKPINHPTGDDLVPSDTYRTMIVKVIPV
jgi:hypothetical protein